MSTSVADVSVMLTNTQGTATKIPPMNPNKSENGSFTDFMNTTAEKPADNKQVNETVKQTKTVVEKPGRKVPEEQQTDLAQDMTKTEDSKAVDAVSETANEVKDAIKEKFGITDEELEAIMENLNITPADLLNPDVLKDLMVTLNGQEDVVLALTDEALYTDIKEIVSLANELTEEIKAEFNLSDEEFAQLIDEVKETVSLEPAETGADISVHGEEKTDENAPRFRVEIETSEDARTADPLSRVTATNIPVTQTQNTDKQNETSEDNEAFAQTGQPQQTVTTHQVGDVVETVRQYTGQVNGQEIVNQVTEYIKVNITPETTSMELQLHPASLGAIHMQILAQNGIVTAQLLVQSESVKEALESQLLQLQETFNEQGTKVEAVEVAVASYDLDRGPFQDRDDRQERQNADDSSRGRRRINLNLNDPELSELELSEEDQLAKDVMEMNGTSVDFTA